ncbi:MAG: hypothetical protein JW982_03320 [Spirochaetes bacterium]|nr:hypothetical protein [Spirochaetota bacterium]
MKQAIITKGKLINTRTIILEEDIFSRNDNFEIILKPVNKIQERSAYSNEIHINYETEDTLKDLIDFN